MFQKKYTVVLSGLLICGASTFISCINKPDDPDDGVVQKVWECTIPSGTVPDYVMSIGCEADFVALASQPMDASIPGVTSTKTVIDTDDPDSPLYFQNSNKFTVHYDFAKKYLSGGENHETVQPLREFNETQYYSLKRRFILGALSYYEGPKVWVYEISPYDNAGAAMIELAFKKVADSTFLGDKLYFHPTSVAVEEEAEKLSPNIKVLTNDSLYKGIDYQPLNTGTGLGRLVFLTAKELDTAYVSYRDIVVLEAVPNDISVTAGIITQMFQTPLAHINVLSRNRGTPNMGLRNAMADSMLLAFKGKWVQLEVTPFEWKMKEVSVDEADAWWEAHRPATVGVAKMNLDVKDLRNVEDILDLTKLSLGDAIDSAIPAFGGKASHFGAFPHMDKAKVPYPKAFAVPVYYYWQFMEQNGFNRQVEALLADSQFRSDPAIRDVRLAALRDAMMDAPIDTAFENMLFVKLKAEYSGTIMRFRSSTNAEDLDGFTGAGLYVSKSGDPAKPKSVRNAIREVWGSVWYFRAFEERSYRNITHTSVGMALLVHQSFPDEEATGVAISGNIFDSAGLEPGFYVNVQYGDGSVVLPDAAVTTDQFIYHYSMPGQPIVYIGRSNQLPEGMKTVLTSDQVRVLGVALVEINRFFNEVYGNNTGIWWAMDTEFKFDQPLDNPAGAPVLSMKQARPYPGFGK